MELTLLTVSRLCSDIINSTPLVLSLDNPILSELYDQIYDVYPTLDNSKYTLYWRYQSETFYQITDYLSYIMGLTLTADKIFILLLNDCQDRCENNQPFLNKLDEQLLRQQVESMRDKYYVKRKPKNENDTWISAEIPDDLGTDYRKDFEIIHYAIRTLPERHFYTCDLILKSNLIRDVKKGWPKLKNKLTQPNEEVIERVVSKDASKKGSKDKKKNNKKKKK